MTSDTVPLTDGQAAKPPSQWLRYGLLLLLFVLIAIPLGLTVNRAMNQRSVVAELQKLNAHILYDYENVPPSSRANASPPGPKWLIDLIGRDYVAEVFHVSVGGPSVADETIALIGRLPAVEFVNILGSSQITDRGLVHFAGMHNLQGLSLYTDRVTGAGLGHLAGVPGLKYLSIDGPITDFYLDKVSKLDRLEFLEVRSVGKITDRGLVNIATLTRMRWLTLGNGSTNPSGTKDFMRATDEGLDALCSLKTLEALILNTANVTPGGIQKLRNALPNCRIEWNPKEPYDPQVIDGDDDTPGLKP